MDKKIITFQKEIKERKKSENYDNSIFEQNKQIEFINKLFQNIDFNEKKICISEIKAKLNSYKNQDIQKKSLDAFFSLGCKGYGRVDFMISDKKDLFFIEVNTIPGFTDHSLMPMSAKTEGIGFDSLVLKILEETCD